MTRKLSWQKSDRTVYRLFNGEVLIGAVSYFNDSKTEYECWYRLGPESTTHHGPNKPSLDSACVWVESNYREALNATVAVDEEDDAMEEWLSRLPRPCSQCQTDPNSCGIGGCEKTAPVPCGPTCQHHVTHPCEDCGTQWGPAQEIWSSEIVTPAGLERLAVTPSAEGPVLRAYRDGKAVLPGDLSPVALASALMDMVEQRGNDAEWGTLVA